MHNEYFNGKKIYRYSKPLQTVAIDIFNKIDTTRLKQIYTITNKARIDQLKIAAKASRKPKGTRKPTILNEPVGLLCRLSKPLVERVLKRDPKLIANFFDQPEWVQHYVVQLSGNTINYIREPLDSTYELLVRNKITGISTITLSKFTPERQKELKRLSLEAHKGESIKYMRNLDEDLKALAIQLSPSAINYCGSDVSEDLKMLNSIRWKI